MLKDYYNLTKPGIVYGNLLTTLAAYLYASRWMLTTRPVWEDFLATMIGLGLVIASACVFNNFLDRDIDAKMKRTKARALVSGAIPTMGALLFGTVLGIIGFALLLTFVNILTAFIALVGFLVYVLAYTFLKRTTEWATEIGSIAGAVPIVVGYTAVTGRFDWVAFILFLIMIFWQMPHFYSIAMFRSDEYAAAGIPVLPLRQGTWQTQVRMLVYIVAFGLAAFALTWFNDAGFAFLVVVEAFALTWFWRGAQGFKTPTEHWARQLFFLSLYVLLALSAMLALTPFLP